MQGKISPNLNKLGLTAFSLLSVTALSFVAATGNLKTVDQAVNPGVSGVSVEPRSQEASSKTVETTDFPCLVREYNGAIALFHSMESKPFSILSIYVVNLPDYDQEQLRTGIMVNGETELRPLLEDFDH